MLKHFLFLMLLLTSSCYAATDAYSFATPQQQQRFQQLMTELRCLVCQNEDLADSNATLAADLRQQVALMVQQGQSNQQITDYLVKRYGNFILYRPPVENNTLLLWIAPFLLLFAGLGMVIWTVTQRKQKAAAATVSPDKQPQAPSV